MQIITNLMLMTIFTQRCFLSLSFSLSISISLLCVCVCVFLLIVFPLYFVSLSHSQKTCTKVCVYVVRGEVKNICRENTNKTAALAYVQFFLFRYSLLQLWSPSYDVGMHRQENRKCKTNVTNCCCFFTLLRSAHGISFTIW